MENVILTKINRHKPVFTTYMVKHIMIHRNSDKFCNDAILCAVRVGILHIITYYAKILEMEPPEDTKGYALHQETCGIALSQLQKLLSVLNLQSARNHIQNDIENNIQIDSLIEQATFALQEFEQTIDNTEI